MVLATLNMRKFAFVTMCKTKHSIYIHLADSHSCKCEQLTIAKSKKLWRMKVNEIFITQTPSFVRIIYYFGSTNDNLANCAEAVFPRIQSAHSQTHIIFHTRTTPEKTIRLYDGAGWARYNHNCGKSKPCIKLYRRN